MTWNNSTYNTPWINKGGDWYDRTNAAQGNAPYASVTFDASALPDNRYYDLDVTELVQGYVNGTYSNTGFFLKAKDENDNYIAFYSSEWSHCTGFLFLNVMSGLSQGEHRRDHRNFSYQMLSSPGYSAVRNTR